MKGTFLPRLSTLRPVLALSRLTEATAAGEIKGASQKKRLAWQSRMAAGTCLVVLMAVPAFGQDMEKVNAAAPVHPIPTAPKKSYTPASAYASPGLECTLYPTGSAASAGLPVYTDDDGYARFHAVRAVAGDAVHQLNMDCTDSAGHSSSYIVDLTSDDTFAPRPLNLTNERGTDRPALEGDPLSYTESQLIQAGYGLRPNPGKERAGYARWLAAASVPGRMLEAKRPKSPYSHTVYTGPGGCCWVGSVLTGAPNYIYTVATFNVPTAIPGGDETTGTETAVWNGLGGNGTGSGLIQGGVGIRTTPVIATYYSWREYCCGDGVSNNYSGNFTPRPGDQIYSEEWYCDSVGHADLSGGYGCTFLQDETTGAIFNCTVANGSPCGSVPALPLCSVSPKSPNCMTVGLSAEFVIENQSPQLNLTPPSTAFTDFSPGVTMWGYAFSSKTGLDQTIGNDPVVTVLTDFTNTTSHMSVSLEQPSSTYFSVSQWAPFPGIANSQPVLCPPIPHCSAQSIAVGPNVLNSLFNPSPVGNPWVLGAGHTAGGDHYIYNWQNTENATSGEWVQQPGAATQIAVSPQGIPWVVNHLGQIFYWDGSVFVPVPAGGCATAIGVGPNAYGSQYGDPWIIGCDGWGSNGYIYQLQGSTWVRQTGGVNGQATQIAVSPQGVPWVINSLGNIYRWNGSTWVGPIGACATSIAVGPNTAPLAGPYGDVWVTGCGSGSAGYNIWQLQNGQSWVQVPGESTQISVSPDLGVPWVVNSFGNIFK